MSWSVFLLYCSSNFSHYDTPIYSVIYAISFIQAIVDLGERLVERIKILGKKNSEEVRPFIDIIQVEFVWLQKFASMLLNIATSIMELLLLLKSHKI